MHYMRRMVLPQRVFITLILIIVIIGLIRVWLKILKMIYIYLNMLKGDIIGYWVRIMSILVI